MSRANICRERQQLLRPLCNLVLLPSSSVFGDNKKKNYLTLISFSNCLSIYFFFFFNLIHNNTTALISTTNSTSLC